MNITAKTKMKQYIPYLILILCFSSCHSAQRMDQPIVETVELKINYLNGYFVKNTVEIEAETLHLIISNQKSFDAYFGVAKTMNNTISEVDFRNNNVVAIIKKASTMSQNVSIKGALGNNELLNVYYETNMMEEQTYSSVAMKLFQIPKTYKTVKFISEKVSETLMVEN